MTLMLGETHHSVLDVLRGSREARPPSDATSVAGLRASLEDALSDLIDETALTTPIIFRASSLRYWPEVEVGVAAPGRVRGVLVTHALRLWSAGLCVAGGFEEALQAWRSEGQRNDLTEFVDRLEANDRARLAADVEAHWVTLRDSLGPLSSRWLPRTALRAYQRLCDGRVILRDVVDLMVGTTSGADASIALLDVTTSPLTDGDESVARYHALVQTLRTGVAPLRTSIFSTATGALLSLDVNAELLACSVDDVLTAVRSMTSNP
jgi:hypothetical protein